MAATKAKQAKALEKVTNGGGKQTRREILRRALLDTADQKGDTNPRRVFDAAKNPNNPLHSEFTWDGESAILELGLQRAAELIRTILKVEVVHGTTRIVAPYYVSDPRENNTRNYMPLASVKSDIEISRAVMHDELSRIESAINRAVAITDFLELKNEFDKMLESIVHIRARVGSAK
jgi:hypothetical protein